MRIEESSACAEKWSGHFLVIVSSIDHTGMVVMSSLPGMDVTIIFKVEVNVHHKPVNSDLMHFERIEEELQL